MAKSRVMQSWSVWLAMVGCGLATAVTVRAEEQANAPQPVHREARPASTDPSVARTDFILSGQEFQTREARLSEPLRALRLRYRKGRLINEPDKLQMAMAEIAVEAAEDMPEDSDPEILRWLQLLQDARFVAGDTEEAYGTLERRYALMAQRMDRDTLIDQIVEEGEVATAQGLYDLALRMYGQAETLSETEAQTFKAVMATGRMYLQAEGPDVAAGYYYALRDAYMGKYPELAREAHFRIAQVYFSAGRLPLALSILDDVQTSYPESVQADRARHAERAWVPLPREQDLHQQTSEKG